MALISKECPTKIFSSFVMDWNIERNTFCCTSKLDTINTNFELNTAVKRNLYNTMKYYIKVLQKNKVLVNFEITKTFGTC